MLRQSQAPAIEDVNDLLKQKGEVIRRSAVVIYREEIPASGTWSGHRYMEQGCLLVATDTRLAIFRLDSEGTFRKRSFIVEGSSYKYRQMLNVRVSEPPMPTLAFHADPLDITFVSLDEDSTWNQLILFVAERLKPPREPEPGRPWGYDGRPEYTYVEALRHRDNQPFDTLVQVGQRLSAHLQRSAFAGAGVDDRGAIVTPSWCNARNLYVAPNGDVIATGWPTHALFGLPDPLDLGAIDGRNMDQWEGTAPQGLMLPQHSFYLGSNRDKRFEMMRIGGDVISFDVAADGRAVAVESWHDNESGMGWTVASVDSVTGERDYVANLPRLAGNERARLSPDGKWLLVTAWPSPILVGLESGRVTTLPIADCVGSSWWPSAGSSCIGLLTRNSDNTVRLRSLDLETARDEDHGPLTIPDHDIRPDWLPVLTLEIHPQDDKALVGTLLGTAAAYQQERGAGRRIASLDLDSRRVDLMYEPFIDAEQEIEREHLAWRWSARPEPRPTLVHESLQAGGQVSSPGPPADTSWSASDARNLALMSARAIWDHPDASPQRLRSEALRGFEGSCRWGRDEQIVEWFKAQSADIGEWLAEIDQSGSSLPMEAVAMREYAKAIDLISAGRADEIDWRLGSFA